jgi:hypothetical protein
VELFDGATSKGVTTAMSGGSWSKSLTALADGSHTFTAVATDVAGNTSSVSNARTVVVDTSAPDTSIESGPSDPTAATTATFALTANEPGGGFECRLDSGAWAACSSPETYEGLAEGTHAFEVRAVDAAGNTDASPAVWIWVIDLTAPESSIDSGPTDPTTQPDATFTFSADDPSATFECRLDSGAWAVCVSPETWTGLEPGAHVFEVRALDAAGNADSTPAAYAWTVT